MEVSQVLSMYTSHVTDEDAQVEVLSVTQRSLSTWTSRALSHVVTGTSTIPSFTDYP
jgi:hypothetical protein